MRRGFTILDHPSDLGIEACGETLAAAFCEAGRGLMSVIVDVPASPPSEKREIRLHGTDHEHLLVKWLSEILFLYDGTRFVAEQFAIHTLTPGDLRGVVYGRTFSPDLHRAKLDVKAITYHQLAIAEKDGGYAVRVYLDI